MTQFSPLPQNVTYLQNGQAWDIQEVENPLCVGVSQPTYFQYDIIPAAPSTQFICSTNTVTAGQALPLTAANTSTFLGQSVVVLDCLRVPTITLGGTTTALTTITVIMYDHRNVLTTMSANIPSGTTTGTYNIGTYSSGFGTLANLTAAKAGLTIVSVTLTENPGVSVSIGIGGDTGGDVFGLPFFVPRAQYIKNMSWNNAALSPYTTGVVLPGFQFNPLSIVNGVLTPSTNTPTATTNDARGLIVVPSAATGTALLSVMMYVYGADSQLQALLHNQTQAALNGQLVQAPCQSALTQTQILSSAGNAGQMLEMDEVGWQYPGIS